MLPSRQGRCNTEFCRATVPGAAKYVGESTGNILIQVKSAADPKNGLPEFRRARQICNIRQECCCSELLAESSQMSPELGPDGGDFLGLPARTVRAARMMTPK